MTSRGLSNPSSYQVPDDLFYTKEHEWARVKGGTAKVGITDYAAKTLNDIVYLTLPSAGQEVKQLSSFGTVESIKAVSELYSPLSGTVLVTNEELVNHPELINKSPYEAGWIIELKPSELDAEKKTLLSSKQYQEFLKSLEDEHHN
jgi:glycine cleavage system H protein